MKSMKMNVSLTRSSREIRAKEKIVARTVIRERDTFFSFISIFISIQVVSLFSLPIQNQNRIRCIFIQINALNKW